MADAKLIDPRAGVPFSQYMEDDNLPSNSDSDSPGSDTPAPVRNRPDGINNGKVDYPLPPDSHAPPGPPDIASTPRDPEAADEISDFGWNERVSVGHGGSAHDFGIAKGEVEQGGMDDSISGQGFRKGG